MLRNEVRVLVPGDDLERGRPVSGARSHRFENRTEPRPVADRKIERVRQPELSVGRNVRSCHLSASSECFEDHQTESFHARRMAEQGRARVEGR